MKKIKMLKTAPGHDENKDGINQPVKTYEKDESYEVCDSLAASFLDSGVAEIEKGALKSASKPTADAKNKGAAPENKGA